MLGVGVTGAYMQHRLAPIFHHATAKFQIDWARATVVVGMVASIVTTNIASNVWFPGLEEVAPLIGIALRIAILVALFARRPDWAIAPQAAKGALFLIALVALASLMPVEMLPEPSWQTAFRIALLSSMSDNIPLTALVLRQGSYDWSLLAYAVGFGGSIIWFGSSAGVALTDQFPEG